MLFKNIKNVLALRATEFTFFELVTRIFITKKNLDPLWFDRTLNSALK